jgi:hypothetical protein
MFVLMLVLDQSVFLTYDPGHNAAAVRPLREAAMPWLGS